MSICFESFKMGAIAMLSVIYKNQCSYCGAEITDIENSSLCRSCWNKIKIHEGPRCIKCGTVYSAPMEHTGIDHLCSRCLASEIPFSHARAFTVYSGAVREAIHAFKYNANLAAGKKLSRFLTETYTANLMFHGCNLLTFVPLHRKRRKERGFNQSELLALWLSNNIKTPVEGLLKRNFNTHPQTGLSSVERKNNLKNAFSVVKKDLLAGKKILLIDDIFTTGTTVIECSRILMKEGAESVYVLTLAIA